MPLGAPPRDENELFGKVLRPQPGGARSGDLAQR